MFSKHCPDFHSPSKQNHIAQPNKTLWVFLASSPVVDLN